MALNVRLGRLDVGDLSDLFRQGDTPEGHVGRWSDQWLSCKRLDIGTWGIVSRNGAEGIRFAKKQRAELGLANPRRILEYGLEYRLKLTGGA